MTILIADDDRLLTHLLGAHLKKRGYQVVVAYDAMQAIMAALRNPPDAIVLDIQMPAGSGLQTMRQLRSSFKTSHVPVIIVSAHLEPDTVANLRQMDIQHFLPKPPDLEKLDAILDSVLAAEQQRRQAVSVAS